MRPCVGVDGICPPLCTWSQLSDGTYTLADVERFNQAIDDLTASHRNALTEARRNLENNQRRK